jgi:ABC-type glycerol-3-phosphate transport system permease component
MRAWNTYLCQLIYYNVVAFTHQILVLATVLSGRREGFVVVLAAVVVTVLVVVYLCACVFLCVYDYMGVRMFVSVCRFVSM